jgi:hypothetical protein
MQSHRVRPKHVDRKDIARIRGTFRISRQRASIDRLCTERRMPLGNKKLNRHKIENFTVSFPEMSVRSAKIESENNSE